MRKVICILAMVFFISGCDNNSFLEKIGLKVKITRVIQVRNGIAYLPNSDEPFTGRHEAYDANGQKGAEAEYKDGKIDGLLTFFYANGQKKDESNYNDGKQNGLTTVFYENGQVQSESNYKDGKQNGLTTYFYQNGQKQSEDNYIDGTQNGLTTYFYENGQKKAEYNYKDGKKNGLMTVFYENGQKQSEDNYIDGTQHGLTTYFDESGQKVVGAIPANDGNNSSTNITTPNDGIVDYSKLKQTEGMTKAQLKEIMGPPEDVTSETLWRYTVIHPDSGKPSKCLVLFYGSTQDRVTKIHC